MVVAFPWIRLLVVILCTSIPGLGLAQVVPLGDVCDNAIPECPGHLEIGRSLPGIVTISGSVGGYDVVRVAGQTNVPGTLLVPAAGTLSTKNLRVGANGVGTLVISGGGR